MPNVDAPDAIITRDVNRYFGDPTVFPVRLGANVCGQMFTDIYHDETVRPNEFSEGWFAEVLLCRLLPRS